MESILSLNNLLDNNNFNDTDFIVNKLNDVYIQTAKNSMKFRPNKRFMSGRIKAKPKKFWMSIDCLLLRKEVRSLGSKLSKDPHNNALRQTFCNCRREYNKLKKKLKRDFFQTLVKTVR